MRNTPRVGVIGLGLLGTALAERLLDAGFQVVVYNRTRSKADSLIQLGARWSDNPLAECDRVVISLYTTEVVELVLEDLESELRPGHLLLDTTTGEPSQTETLGTRMYDRGVEYLETPIAASSEQTRRGEAVAIVGGTSEAFRTGRDLLNVIAAKSFHVGGWGAAAKIKLVNNLILGLHRVALAEGLAFARAIGIDPADALDVVKQGSAYSNAMDAKGGKMVKRDFSTQAKLSQHLKDIRLILEEARLANLPVPFTALHRQTLERLEELGFGEEDNSAIIRAFDTESP
jgi:3-hydroxyisobutyrate dehydrogenase-like beta-hydroxyacid dehydrogenase